jgi:hypothetical protein
MIVFARGSKPDNWLTNIAGDSNIKPPEELRNELLQIAASIDQRVLKKVDNRNQSTDDSKMNATK